MKLSRYRSTILIVISTCWLQTAFAQTFTLNSITKTNSYYKLLFHGGFNSNYPNSYPDSANQDRGTITVYPASGKGSVADLDMLYFPQHILDRIISSQTSNAFRKVYPQIYQAQHLEKLRKCPFLGTQFELDNDASTSEWLATISIPLCLRLEKRGVDSNPHMWIVQKQADNTWRVLMESDSSISVINSSQNDRPAYKHLKTWLYNRRSWLGHENNCGGARIVWKYQDEQYHPIELHYQTHDCDFQNSHSEVRMQYEKKHLANIKLMVDQRLDNLEKPHLNQSTATARKKSVSMVPDKIRHSKKTDFSDNERKAIEILLNQ